MQSLPAENARELLLSEIARMNRWELKKQSVNIDNNEFMFENNLVIDMVKNPYSFYELTKEIIKDADVSSEQKVLLIKLSQCLSDTDYLSLGSIVYKSNFLPKNKIKLMNAVINPGYEWGIKFSVNYNDDLYSNFLDLLISDAAYIELLPTIENINSGNDLEFIKAYSAEEGNFPRINCE